MIKECPDKLWSHAHVPGFEYKALETIKIIDRLTLDILKKFDTILSCGTTLVDAHSNETKMYNTTRIIPHPKI